jgi:FG-GAP-like repeat
VLATLILAMGATAAFATNPLPLINAPLFPSEKAPGSAAFTLNVTGTGFVSGAIVNWNGNARITTFVSSSQVTATINAADVATAGTALVTVSNPAPGGGSSNPAFFEVVKGGYPVAFSLLNYNTDLTPQDVATGDFNRDGKADLAVATGNNTVSVLLGAGDGTFPTHVEYPVPGHPSAVLVADFNGDGKLDIATIDPYQSEISILLGNGDGTFQGHQEYLTGTHPVAFATADLNGDGKLDIVVADLNDNKVAVLLGNGDGTFKSHVDYATGNGPSGVAIGDYNRDGKLDLAVVDNSDTTVAILLGNGDGTFEGPVPFPVATGANSVVTGDFNADGKLDLAVGTSNSQVSILLGNGDGTFQNHKEYAIGANSVTVATADLNGDSKLDLISANFNDNTISVLAGNGDGTFKGESVFPTGAGPFALAVGDYNGNGKLDVAVVASTANQVSVLTDSVISLSPSVFAFGTQTSGDKSTAKTMTLKNNGTTTYTVPAPVFIGASASDFTQTNTCGASVLAGKTCTYSITFLPTASEVADAQMTLTSSNGSLIGIQLQGKGNIPIYLTPRKQTFPTTLLFTKSAGKSNTFTNKSGVNIYFSNIDLEGANQNDFSFTSTCDKTGVIPLLPAASCTSTVYFTPTFQSPAGNETVTMVYYGNFTLVKQGLLINGEGTAVMVSPTTLNFGTQKVGTTSAPMTITFQNAGTSAMPITSTGFSGTAPYWSIQASSTTCTNSVPASSSCTYGIVFTPQAVGTFTATFSIGDPDWTGPQKVTLNGTGD